MALKEKESRELIEHNLRHLMYVHGISSQKALAATLGISTSMLCKIINGEQYPAVYPFLANIENKFGCSISNFLFTDLRQTVIQSETDRREKSMANQYEGAYQLYYYSEDEQTLRSGVLLIKRQDSVKQRHDVTLTFGIAPARAAERLEETNQYLKKHSYMDADNYLASFSGEGEIYKGTLSLAKGYMFFVLTDVRDGSKMFMMFHKPLSETQKYQGGLGMLSVVGDSRDQVLTQRYVGIQRKSICDQDNKILEALSIKSNRQEHDYKKEVQHVLHQYKDGVLGVDFYTAEEHELLATAKLNELVKKSENDVGGIISVTIKKDDLWCDMMNNIIKKTACK